VRFGLLAMSSSQDVRYSAEKVSQGRALANKLWNASRFVLLSADDVEAAPKPTTVEDRWILSRLERATDDVTKLLDDFQLSRTALDLYDVIWGEVCDWYLELVKPRLYDDDADKSDLSATMLYALERVLRLLHPLMPFVTEEIWAHLPGERDLLAVAEWPSSDPSLADPEAEAVVGRTIAAVTALRRYRDDVGVAASVKVPARLDAPGYEDIADNVARLARFEWAAAGAASNGEEPVATVAIPGGVVHVMASEAIDPEEAAKRVEAQREKLRGEIKRAEAKLANEKFVDRAPAQVVDAEREKLERYKAELEAL